MEPLNKLTDLLTNRTKRTNEGFAFLTSIAIFIGLLFLLGIVLFIVAGVIIDTVIQVCIIVIALSLILVFLVRATGFNPVTMESSSPTQDSLSWLLIIGALGLVIGLPYLDAQSLASTADPLQDPYTFSAASLDSAFTTLTAYWFYVAMFFITLLVVVKNEKLIRKKFGIK